MSNARRAIKKLPDGRFIRTTRMHGVDFRFFFPQTPGMITDNSDRRRGVFVAISRRCETFAAGAHLRRVDGFRFRLLPRGCIHVKQHFYIDRVPTRRYSSTVATRTYCDAVDSFQHVIYWHFYAIDYIVNLTYIQSIALKLVM